MPPYINPVINRLIKEAGKLAKPLGPLAEATKTGFEQLVEAGTKTLEKIYPEAKLAVPGATLDARKFAEEFIKKSVAETEVLREMRELQRGGAKTYYRNTGAPRALFDRGWNSYKDANPKLNTAAEPYGLYFADRAPDIGPLLNPGMPPHTLSNLHNMYVRYQRQLDPSYQRGLVAGVLKPGTKHKVFNIDEWLDYLEGMGREFGKPLVNRSGKVNWEIGGNEEARAAADLLTRDLAEGWGYDVVSFPDTVARQPEYMQTVLLKKGKMLARWRQGVNTGAGVLGVGGLAIPTWKDKEQTHR